MDRHTYSPLGPDPDVHETGGLDGPNPSARHLNARQFGQGTEPRGATSMGAPTGYTLAHYGRTSPAPCRPCGGDVNDADNGLVPGYRPGTEFRHAPAPEFPEHTWLERNVVPVPKHQGEGGGFEAEARISRGGRP